MRKLLIACALALLALVVVAGPALACDPNAKVECSDIDVTDDSPVVGTTITFSGTVDITAESSVKGFISIAGASSYAYYVVRDPEGNIVAQGMSELSDSGIGWLCADANASQTFSWTTDVYIALVGDYIAEHGGSAEVYYLAVFPPKCGYDSDSCMTELTVTATAAGMALPKHPVLTIVLPNGRGLFFGSDGWDDPTDQDITSTDGTWEVAIAAGTLIQMDGKWHDRTWLIVDDYGGVTGQYGNGKTVATDIGLSQPIVITKVS